MAQTPWYALGESQGFYWTPQNTHAHSGIDLATDPGRPITAPFDAVQESQGTEPWGGQENIQITDSSGQAESLTWIHLSSEVPLQRGTPIHAGDLLGYSGTPPPGFGNGPHIHFERTIGKTPAYMGYNPWYPTASSHPLSPQPILDQLKAQGPGGTLGVAGKTGGLADYSSTQAGYSGPDPFGIQSAFSGFEHAIGQDVQGVQTAISDTLKRIGVFAIGAILAIVGLLIIFAPLVKNDLEHFQGVAKELVGGGNSGTSSADIPGPADKPIDYTKDSKTTARPAALKPQNEPIFSGGQKIGHMENGKMVFEGGAGAAKAAKVAA